MDDLNPNTSQAVVNGMATLLGYKKFTPGDGVRHHPVRPSPRQPIDRRNQNQPRAHRVLGILRGDGLLACFLFMWRSTSNDDPDPEGSPHELQRDKYPRMSIIVPAYNEEARIEDCVNAALGQDYAGPIEVIVVNDGSTDGTLVKASKHAVRIIDQKTNRGKAAALNVGVGESTGDIIVFSDSDSRMANDSVRFLVEYIQRNRGSVRWQGAFL